MSFFFLACIATVLSVPCSLISEGSLVTISNGYTRLQLDSTKPVFTSIQGDFTGQAQFSSPSLLAGLALEREDPDGTTHSSSTGAGPGFSFTVLTNTSDLVAVVIAGVVDDVKSPAASETWTISLHETDRFFTFQLAGHVVRNFTGRAVRHSFYYWPPSSNAFYEKGVIQMMNAPGGRDFFGSSNPLIRYYATGKGAVDMQRISGPLPKSQTVVLSGMGVPYSSGLQEVLAGSYDPLDMWTEGWAGVSSTPITTASSWNIVWKIAPNDAHFPVLNLTTGQNLPPKDLSSLLQAVYTSGSVGCLVGYDDNTPGEIAPGLHNPDTAYVGTYNYFDPDSFFLLSGMMYSGDPYLLDIARQVIERSGSKMLATGQLPHHFENYPSTPTYVALSGATQTGPNLFWALAALRYVANSGDQAWLSHYMPTLRLGVSYLTQMVDAKTGLLYAEGSLMIDVFIRNNFTSDSNAMLVPLLQEFAYAEEAVGNTTGATALRTMAQRVASQMNTLMWANSDDHYVTQINRDLRTIRDFVDYDSNFIAIAFNITPPDRAKKFLARADGGRCTHDSKHTGSPTFVAELYYGPDDCFLRNVGDSWCSMARIGYFDALTRRRLGDLQTFEEVLLGPIQADLLSQVWMRERYGCDGLPQTNRSDAYHEYPNFVAMSLREIRYGINLGIQRVTIDPFGPSQFSYHVGNINCDYSPSVVTLTLPGSGNRTFFVTVQPGSTFNLTTSPSCVASSSPIKSDQNGLVSFIAEVGDACTIHLVESRLREFS